VRLSPLGTSATVGLLYQPRMIDYDYGAVGGIRIGRGNQSTRRKPAAVPLCPPQIPHDLTWDRTRAAAMGSQRLTAWAMARQYRELVFHETKSVLRVQRQFWRKYGRTYQMNYGLLVGASVLWTLIVPVKERYRHTFCERRACWSVSKYKSVWHGDRQLDIAKHFLEKSFESAFICVLIGY
jgi:hypothetical protein